MTIGITVSEIRRFPKALNKEGYEFIEIKSGHLKEYISQCDILYMWNLVYEEMRECLLDTNELPRYIYIARQGKDVCISLLAKLKHIELSYADNVFTESISEFVLASLLILSKGLHYSAAIPEWKKYVQKRVKGSSALILGKGNVAKASAILLQNNGIEVQMAGKAEMYSFAENGTLFTKEKGQLFNINHLICCLPLNNSTEGLLNLSFFSLFKNANFVNISRGRIIDLAGLNLAMEQGHIYGAVLDAFEEEPLSQDSPLWSDERVVVSAHQSYFSADWEEKLHESFLNFVEKVQIQSSL